MQTWYAGKFKEWDWGLVAEDDDIVFGFVAVAGSHLDQLFVDPITKSKASVHACWQKF